MSEFVNAARSWIGTPYMHQASVKGVGCDCLGLLRGVWRDVLGVEPEPVPVYTPDWSEPQGAERLHEAALRHLTPVETDQVVAGQIVLFRMRDGAVAKHLGIVSMNDPTPHFIHAYSGHGVVESPLALPWRKRISARFIVPKG